MSDPVVILGLGFTTQRLARRLRQRDVPVYGIIRAPARFTELAALGVRLCELDACNTANLPHDAVLVHSVPPLTEPETSAIRKLVRELAPRRILYISSTSAYGAQPDVTDNTAVAPNDEKGRRRVGEEEWIASCSHWQSLILRSAAIYGPGRGVHAKLREGKLARGIGRIVSRIHVDDLVAILEAGIQSDVTGAWPVADERPADSGEVAAWCANRMGLILPDGPQPSFMEGRTEGMGGRTDGRRVNGRRIRELLGVELKFASYQAGIDASLLEESQNAQRDNA
jgi:nucleoside-diphosphate-sugar epimerase